MAMELESRIMAEIGLHTHYNWFNGSGSCAGIRRAAVELLPKAIAKHKKAKEKIKIPSSRMMKLLRNVADYGDESMYSLTKTWQACSEAIAACIHAGHGDKEIMAHIEKYIEENYARNFNEGRHANYVNPFGNIKFMDF
jgi:hypothetical protein